MRTADLRIALGLLSFNNTVNATLAFVFQKNMSSIASPRVSTSLRSPASSRTSLEIPPGRTTHTRRNRAALRDYYGLKVTEEIAEKNHDAPKNDELVSELDTEGFDAEEYVREILSKEGLESILKIEANLLSGRCSQIFKN